MNVHGCATLPLLDSLAYRHPFEEAKIAASPTHAPYCFCNDDEYYIVFGSVDGCFKDALQKTLDGFQIYGDVVQLDCKLTADQVRLFDILYENAKHLHNKLDGRAIEDVCKKHETFFADHYVPFYTNMQSLFSMSLATNKSADTNAAPNPTSYVLYNIPFKTSVIVDESKVPSSTWSQYPEVFAVCRGSYLDMYTPTIQDKQFETVAVLQNLIQKLDEAMRLAVSCTPSGPSSPSAPSATGTEKNKVISFIQTNYVISDNVEPEFRMKAQDIAQELEKGLGIENDQSFKIRLAGYLIEAGLKKKRFSNGFYYYGIKKKFNPMSQEQLHNVDIEALRKAREDETNSILSIDLVKKENAKPWAPMGSYLQTTPLEHVQSFNEDYECKFATTEWLSDSRPTMCGTQNQSQMASKPPDFVDWIHQVRAQEKH